MTKTSADGPPPPGLRERKKARTRAAIQDEALRLFRERGYDETTVEQIAEAVEVSPSTFFRYFPSKEDVVLYDPIDPLIIAAVRAQPPEIGPIAAMRRAMRSVFGGESARGRMEQMEERGELIQTVPELRMRMLDQLMSSMQPFAEAIAERVGRPADDPAVQTLIGAVVGVGLAVWLDSNATVDTFVDRIDAGMALLEAGLPL